MLKSVKSRAEQQFAATQKKDRQALKEKERAAEERAEHVAHLKSLRLAKAAADKIVADEAAAAKAAAKPKKKAPAAKAV